MADGIDDDELLDLLQLKEDQAGHYIWGQLGTERQTALREYHRQPYGNEEDGWSQIVTSDVQDTVEWVLPALLRIFTSTDKAVEFEPTRASDVDGAKQATDACNYIFFRQNSGFLILYNAIKDALTVRNGCVTWRKETKETISVVPFKGATAEMVAMLLAEAGDEGEIVQATEPQPAIGQDGTPLLDPMTLQPIMVMSGRIKKCEKRTTVKVEAIPADSLLVERNWTSPLLAECPYVCVMRPVSLSDVHEMGFADVTADELREDADDLNADGNRSLSTITQTDDRLTTGQDETNNADDSMAEGWLRMEWVLVDADGDGVAERREVIRLKDRILSNEVVGHVPVATWSPLLNPHRWDGQSMHDLVGDLQKLHTEILRQTLNNLLLTNNPRKKVLTDSNWLPMANIDDLLDSRPGGVIRQRTGDAVSDDVTPFAAGASLPMLDYVQSMRENRSGVSRVSMGLNPDSLNNTATGRAQDMSAAMQRVELIARICAETLLKPIMQGILKLLTDGEMERIAFRLRDEFVEYDPNEWRDQYDMTVNVGLGTGDRAQQAQSLQMVMQSQIALMQYGLVTPEHLYHTQTKMIETAGFKDVQNFVRKPPPPDPSAPPPPPPLPIQIKTLEIQGDIAKETKKAELSDQQHQREMLRDVAVDKNRQEVQAQQATLETQVAAERDVQKAALDARQKEADREFERWREEFRARTQLMLKQIDTNPASLLPDGESAETKVMRELVGAMQQFASAVSAPKMIVRDASGRPVGVQPVQGA